MHIKKNIVILSLSLALFFVVGWKFGQFYTEKQIIEAPVFEEDGTRTIIESISDFTVNPQNVDLKLFWTVWSKLEDNFVDPKATQDDQKLVYGSIKGLVDSLDDPFTLFMTPDETKQFEESLQGSLQGIGAELSIEDGLLVIVSPLKDSPAERAGLKPGDIIFLIDGETAAEMSFFDAILAIRGEKGTPVTLTIIREDVAEPFEVTIIRDEITIESITFEILDGNIAYISINQFNDTTPEGIENAIQQILLNNYKGLIVDLRFNGGGFLDIAIDIASEFIEGQKAAVIIKTRNPENDQTLYVTGDARITDIPLVVLVNEGSASASEIVAGAIQDHNRGLIMGMQTFGKGSVQEIEPLEDGSSLRLTIAKWHTPSDHDIEEVGITPDRIVVQDEEDLENEIDTQLEEAREYLINL